MDKLISQQAAIDALCKSECGWNNAECKHKDDTDFCVTCDNVKIIKSLPSAQPEPESIFKWKNEFREYVDSLDIARDDWKGIIEYIDELPSAEPERPTGEWIQKPRYEDDEYPDAQPNLKCPFCGYEIGWCDMGNYCARCGADLKGGAE